MTDILDSESRSHAFERHLKREFSLENLNFIVAVVHYRRLCEKVTHNSHSTIGMLNLEKKTCRKMQEISMQPFGLSCNPMSVDRSNGSYNSIPPTPSCGPLMSELDTSSPFCRSAVSDLGNTAKHRSKRTPLLSWIDSKMELCADKEKIALFIFDEYCNRGAPQEINLGRRERNELVEFFSHSIEDPDKLNTIFDHAFDSILDLLENDSLRRFRRHYRCSKMIKE